MLETAVAAALLTLFLTSLFALNSTVMRMLRSANETADASQELQMRVEQIRLANWLQVTNPTSLKQLLYPNLADANYSPRRNTDGLLDLPAVSEQVDGITYAELTAANLAGRAPNPTFTVTRDPGGNTAASGSVLTDADTIAVRVRVTWQSWGRRPRSRELISVISRWGISK